MGCQVLELYMHEDLLARSAFYSSSKSKITRKKEEEKMQSTTLPFCCTEDALRRCLEVVKK